MQVRIPREVTAILIEPHERIDAIKRPSVNNYPVVFRGRAGEPCLTIVDTRFIAL